MQEDVNEIFRQFSTAIPSPEVDAILISRRYSHQAVLESVDPQGKVRIPQGVKRFQVETECVLETRVIGETRPE